MKTANQILSPSMLLKKLATLTGASRLSPLESMQWLRRFEAADKRRARFEKEHGVPSPQAVIFSPTMRCNYDCVGCYSRTHSQKDELSTARIDSFFGEMQEVGTSVCLVSGGEPFMRQDLPELMFKHPELLFIVFTNGSKITESLARQLGKHRNVVPVLSIEGEESTVSCRRGPAAYRHIEKAIEHFKDAKLIYGFSTMVTRDSLLEITDADFFEKRVAQGHQLGFVLEYVPVGKDVDRSQVLDPVGRSALRQAVISARQKYPFMLFQLPDDGHDGTDCGATRRFMHINSTGGLEPCPFAHHSDSTLGNQSFSEALQSPLFKNIRSTPEVFHKNELSCALAENEEQLRALCTKDCG